MRPDWIIEKKRDGLELSRDELSFFLNGFVTGDVPDYQMSALAMAIYFQGMELEEVSNLTEVMLHSGSVMDTACLKPTPVFDKHSTGGIGDKVSLALAPLVACCGLAIPMISGRGLGITGGTLDKLESIPGFRTDLSESELLRVVKECGCVISGQTSTIAPADGKLYALRDVTATVPSVPLITSSILCKKFAAGLDGLVLDVKVGRGAFMNEMGKAVELAETMVAVGRRVGTPVRALISRMDEPLGRAVGNGVEVYEVLRYLSGDSFPDLDEVVIALAGEMLLMSGVAIDSAQAEVKLREALVSGAALERFKTMVSLQGGDASVLHNLEYFTRSTTQHDLKAQADGWIKCVDAAAVGRACKILGAGRSKVGEPVNHRVGFTQVCKVGERVQVGDVLLRIHAESERDLGEALKELEGGIEISSCEVAPEALICQRAR